MLSVSSTDMLIKNAARQARAESKAKVAEVEQAVKQRGQLRKRQREEQALARADKGKRKKQGSQRQPTMRERRAMQQRVDEEKFRDCLYSWLLNAVEAGRPKDCVTLRQLQLRFAETHEHSMCSVHSFESKIREHLSNFKGKYSFRLNGQIVSVGKAFMGYKFVQ